MKNDTPAPLLLATVVALGALIGFVANIYMKPADAAVAGCPCPPPAVIHDRPVTDLEMVVGLADLTSDLHREVKQLRAEVQAIKSEAQQIINAMIQEIHRLQSQPRIHADEPRVPCET